MDAAVKISLNGSNVLPPFFTWLEAWDINLYRSGVLSERLFKLAFDEQEISFEFKAFCLFDLFLDE